MASKATTEKGAISNATTGSARLNLFFKAVRSLGKDVPQLHELLAASWSEDALDTLKIIFQSRDCRGGKGEKKLFAESLLWLSTQHSSTLGKNIKHIPEFGMWKDLLALVPTPFVDDVLKMFAKQLRDDLNKVQAYEKKQKEKKEKKEAEAQEKKETETQEAQEEKKEGDGADAVTKDTKNKKERPPLPHISLAAKWAPTEKHGDDKKTGSALKLALLLSEDPKTALRDYRKNYLTPLRAHLKIIETFACAQRWDEIPYTLVPSRCMNLHKKEFEKYDKTRFAAYLEDVKAGKSTIKGKQMMPHELVEQYFNKPGGPIDEVIELQWKVIVDETRKLGSLAQSLVLSDVSGSMSGTPMMVSIALGLLISEVTAAPFTNSVVTFHEKPSFHVVAGSTLQARVNSLKRAEWGGTTNFQGVFDLILNKAVANKVPAEHMPKKLFVISDMQFDSADRNYATNFETIKSRYAKSGYAMPQMIFWNVRSSPNDFPVMKDEIGVAMVSGFSPSLLKSILTASDLATPWELLREILDAPRYKVLQV